MVALFSEVIASSRGGNVEHLAVTVRRYYGLDAGKMPWIDLDKLIHKLGLPVAEGADDCMGSIAMDDRKGQLRLGLVLREGLVPDERRFLISYLLGHFFLHLVPFAADGEQSVTGFRAVDSPYLRFCQSGEDGDCKELQEADLFAAALIMPKAMFCKAWSVLSDEKKVADLFGVSSAAVRARQYCIGILPDTNTSESSDVPTGVVSGVAKRAAAQAYGVNDSSQPGIDTQEVSSQPTKHVGLERIREIASQIDDSVAVKRI